MIPIGCSYMVARSWQASTAYTYLGTKIKNMQPKNKGLYHFWVPSIGEEVPQRVLGMVMQWTWKVCCMLAPKNTFFGLEIDRIFAICTKTKQDIEKII